MARGHGVTGHGAQHKLYIPLWVRGRSRAAPRPPVCRREGRCARQRPKCDSCAAGRPCPPPAAPSTREVLGSEAGPRAPPGGRTEAQTKRAGLRGEVRGGSGSSRSGRSLGAGGAVRRAGWWGAPSGVPPTPPNAVRPPWGIFPSLPGRAQGLHVGGHPWQVIRPGGAAMGAGRGPPEVPSPRGLALSGHLRSSCLRGCSWLPHDQQGPRAQPHRLAWPPTWLLDLTVFAVAVGLPALSPRPRGPSPQGPSPQGHRAMLVPGHLPFL